MPKSRRARWILFGLFPLALLTLGLHVREVVRTGYAQPPIYASPGSGPDAYPTVGGETAEVSGPHDLRVGDRLLSIGDRDLRGAGYLTFLGSAFEQAGEKLRAPLVFERDGQRRETVLDLIPFPVPWLRIPFLTMMLALVCLLLLRRPDEPFIQLAAVTFASVAIGESVFDGGSVTQTEVARLIFILGGAVWWPLVVFCVARFPGDREGRPPLPGLSWLALAAAALWVLPKCMYLLGGPVPTARIPAVVSAAEALQIAIPAGIFVASYRRFDAGERRRVRWVVVSTWIAGLAMFAALSLGAIAPGSSVFGLVLAVASVAAAIIPIGVTVAILGYDLFDIDRLISATASYSLVLVLLLAVLLAMVPPLSEAASAAFGVDPETGRLALSMLVAALAVPANRWLRPRVDHWFFPERRRIESGMQALIAEQQSVSDPRGLATQAAGRIHDLFRPRFTAVFVRTDDGRTYERGRAWGDATARSSDGVAANQPLIRRLATATTPLVLSAGPVSNARQAAPEEGGAFLHTWPAALLLPIRDGDTMPAFIAVGPKRSGDVFPPTELALLAAALETAARHLSLVREAEALARERLRAEQLEAAHLTRSRHLAAASHDLRQPLHALRLFSESLIERAGDAESLGLAERIRGSAAALHEMFDSLIDLSRLDQGTLRPELSSFPLRPLLERIRSEAELVAERKGLRLDVDAPDVRVQSDPVLLGRVIQNLLTNALRYTESGRVSLAAALDGPLLRVRVEDTGPGIPASQREAVFAEFVRLEPEKSARGLGLGLSIVHRFAALLEHRLQLESEVGRGTTFTIDVPVSARQANSGTFRIAADETFSGRSLLLVDDDLDVLAAMRSLLEGWGARVTLASDGEEALESVEAGGRFDAIVADYRLAGGEAGADVVEAVRGALGQRIPALVITGSTSSEVVALLEQRGLPMLRKPVSPARLRATLAQLLRAATGDGELA